MEIDWDMANPNEIFKAHENISKCFKKIFSSRKIEKISMKYRRFPKHFNQCISK